MSESILDLFEKQVAAMERGVAAVTGSSGHAAKPTSCPRKAKRRLKTTRLPVATGSPRAAQSIPHPRKTRATRISAAKSVVARSSQAAHSVPFAQQITATQTTEDDPTAVETLITLSPELKIAIISHLDPVSSTCLGLTCKTLYPFHKRVNGLVKLNARHVFSDPKTIGIQKKLRSEELRDLGWHLDGKVYSFTLGARLRELSGPKWTHRRWDVTQRKFCQK